MAVKEPIKFSGWFTKDSSVAAAEALGFTGLFGKPTGTGAGKYEAVGFSGTFTKEAASSD
jgi:hypothetical protein